jgi:hypothetical protein
MGGERTYAVPPPPRQPAGGEDLRGAQGEQPGREGQPEEEESRRQVRRAEDQEVDGAQDRLRRGWRGRGPEGAGLVPPGGVVGEERRRRGWPGREVATPQLPGCEERRRADEEEDAEQEAGDEHGPPTDEAEDPVGRGLGLGTGPCDRALGVRRPPGVTPSDPVRDRLDVGAQPRDELAEEVPQLGVGTDPGPLDLPAQPPRLAQVETVPQPRAHRLPRIGDPTGEQEPQDLGDPDHEVQRHHQQQARRAVVLQQRGEGVALGEVARADEPGLPEPEVVGRGRHVDTASIRDDLDVVAGEPRTPAQVEVVAEQVVAPIEPTEIVQHRPTHEHAAGRDVEGATLLVTLPLVELPLIDTAVGAARDVDRPTHRLQLALVVPAEQLRSDHGEAGIGLHRGHEVRGRGGIEHEVVVQQEHVRRFGGGSGVERHGDRCPEAEIALGDQHAVRPESVDEQLAGAVGAAVVHGDDVETGLCLCVERVERARQPGRAVVRDEHDQHVGGCGGCLHGAGAPARRGGGGPRSSLRAGVTGGPRGTRGGRPRHERAERGPDPAAGR